MTVLFTSDLHLGHANIATLRGFATVEEHDAALAEAWDRTVRPDDVVWVLGDIAMGKFDRALFWLSERPGRKHLIAGNHDPVHPMHRTAPKLQRKWLKVFESIAPFQRISLLGTRVLLSHFPYEGDTDGRGEDRYPQYRLPDEGMPLIHGHTHSARFVTETTAGTVQLHVGVDAHELNNPMPDHELLAALMAVR